MRVLMSLRDRAFGSKLSLGALRNPLITYLARRLLSLGVVLVGLLFASFIMVRLIPGDPVQLAFGDLVDAKVQQSIREGLGLNRPWPEQFVVYIGNLTRGDLGSSYRTQQNVAEIVQLRTVQSLRLAGASLTLVLVLSIPIGMAVAAFTREGRHKRFEVLFTALTSVFGSIPEYLAGTFLAFVFAVWLRLLPLAGDSGWQSLVLPASAIAIRPIAVLARIVRIETLNVLATDYIRTARSKRLPAYLIYLRHALPNVVTAALTIGGLLFAGVIGGAVVVESVFNRQGLGTSLVAAVHNRDYPVVQAIVLVLGMTVVGVNLLVDLLLAIVDPRSLTRQS
jgi:peptide/nickel transport system permease protein